MATTTGSDSVCRCVARDSKGFKEAQRGSEKLREAQRGARGLSKRGSKWLRGKQGASRAPKEAKRGSEGLNGVQRGSAGFRGAQRGSEELAGAQGDSKGFEGAQRGSWPWGSMFGLPLRAVAPRARREHSKMSTPGVEAGLLRPQSDVLATRRCEQTMGVRWRHTAVSLSFASPTMRKQRPKVTPVGFEPTQLALVELESTPLDHSGKVS